MSNNKLPADPLSLILGILALVLGVAGCCCYGITALIPLIMAIIGLVAANKSLKLYEENTEGFSEISRSNVSMARIINIIAVVFNGLIVLVFIGIFIIYGTFLSSAIMDEYKNGDFNTSDPYEWETDTLYDYEQEYEYDTIEVDTIEIDSTIRYEIKEIETTENQ
ncbi:CCC motif membrane protein [uncultured Dokdonia sp.]|uniref:CCC motif membrane protein n=1 Tax=uncultured Dokdonia sp. TaxID=575653 RepID=UPI00260CE4D1|nr:CCC motif membrane protein [uncultured Dokdonia sp.]